MTAPRRINKTYLSGLVALALMSMVGCTEDTPAAIRPHGAAARDINELWWVLLGLGTATYLGVMALALFALFRRRKQDFDYQTNDQNGRRVVWIGGVLFPSLILLTTYGVTLNVLSRLAVPPITNQLVIEVTGHQWWWEVNYPRQNVITANEIYIPTGEEIILRLTSADVIHSFWVPELHGKMDLIPGQTNTWPLYTEQAGDYWGLCAEFCGTQHAKMLFLVIAVPPEEFRAWTESRQQPAPTPPTELAQSGFEVFVEIGCGTCHTIQGTEADGDLGPDLTHFASRRTLGAGSLTNNRSNLAGWVVNPHGTKPGSLMPNAEIAEPDLQALLEYLETLE
ncbi:MAG: cytochrome c oxidase subunit II [Ardenticatenaceae bacterium]|nr:cytochrome c oxidase subunit II [Ardenticatenaceae bacterium]